MRIIKSDILPKLTANYNHFTATLGIIKSDKLPKPQIKYEKKRVLSPVKKCSKGFRTVRFLVLFTLISFFTFRSTCFGCVYRCLHSVIVLTNVNTITYLPNSLSSQDFFCSCCRLAFRRSFSSLSFAISALTTA